MLVPEAKIVKYLLNLESMTGGKDKAIFFMSFGFTIDRWELLAKALLVHAATYEVAGIISKKEGTNYTIEGALIGLDGRRPFVRTIWRIDEGSTAPRFVSAYSV